MDTRKAMAGRGPGRAASLLVAALLLCAVATAARAELADSGGPTVSNVWVDVPLRQVLRDISVQTRVTIAIDPTVGDFLVSLEAEGMALEACLRRATAGQGLTVRKLDDSFYLVGPGRPDSPTFPSLADSRRVYLRYVTAKHVRDSLPRELQPFVSSGERKSEVLVFAPEERRRQIMEIIRDLDVPREQVVLEALVVELSRDAGAELGIDWERSGPDTVFSIVESTENFVGTARYASVDERELRTLLITLRMLISRGLASIRSRPRVATLNGEKATIDIALEQYFNIVTDINGAFLRTELQVIKSGVNLQMTPHIGDDGDITVRVSTEVSDVASEPSDIGSDENSISAGRLPVIRRRKADTTVRVKTGDAIVIGGLIQAQEREEFRRVPVLGSIPLLGALFRSKSETREEREVVIFITPRVMTEGESALSERHSLLDVKKEIQDLRERESPQTLDPEGVELMHEGVSEAVTARPAR